MKVLRLIVLSLVICLIIPVLFGCSHSEDNVRSVTVTLVGDTGLGLNEKARALIREHGYGASFRYVRFALQESDFLIGNNETPIVGPKKKTLFEK